MEKRCIIVSGGRPGPAPQPQPGDFVIACDRGYRYCAGLGLQPDLFIGDFDSYDGAVDPAVPVERLQPEKDDTDTGHAIRHALDQGYRTLILVCALGGRLDTRWQTSRTPLRPRLRVQTSPFSTNVRRSPS